MASQSYSGLSRLWRSCLCWASLLLVACQAQQHEHQASTPQGVARMGAVSQTHFVIGTGRADATLTLYSPASTTIHQPVDILMLFDRTASMRDFIATTASAAHNIVHDIQQQAPNTRFAVASVCDYSPLFTPSPDTRTWLLHADFTRQAEPVVKAFANIELTDGGDFPEAYSRGLYEANQLDWRPDANKIIVFFGDSTDHPIDPGRDETLGTADDLTMPMVLSQLQANGIRVMAIHTRDSADVVAQFEAISQATSGQAIPLAHAASTSQVITDALTNALVKPANLVAIGAQAGWLHAQATASKGSNQLDYRLTIQVPEGTPAGVYRIPLMLTSDNPDDIYAQAFQGKRFEVKVITGWYNQPWVLWLPVALLLGYLGWCSLRMLKGGYKHALHVTSNARFDPNRYTVSYLVIDILALIGVVASTTAVYLCWQNQVLSQLLNTL